jgi:hypothetical protein
MRRQVRRLLAVLAAVIGLTAAVASPASAAPTAHPVQQQSAFAFHPNADWWW